jgi:hypothetical protein
MRSNLQSEDFLVSSPPEKWSVDDKNESDMKCNDEAEHCLLIENQFDIAPFFEASCASK